MLFQYGLVPDDLGGDVMVIPISAKEGKNIDKLVDDHKTHVMAGSLVLLTGVSKPDDDFHAQASMTVLIFLTTEMILSTPDWS